jgi:hypothetical protein
LLCIIEDLAFEMKHAPMKFNNTDTDMIFAGEKRTQCPLVELENIIQKLLTAVPKGW